MATEHAVSSGHYLASEAGLAILNDGGNAVDAGVATGLVLAVVQSDFVNLAGVAPIILWLAETQEVLSIDGLGTWPAAVTPDLFTREHRGVIPEGLLRTVVPAAPHAWLTALERHGTRSFAEVAEAAIRLAVDGFPMYPLMAAHIAENAEGYRRWPQNAAIYLPGGAPPRVGERFCQVDLASTLQHMVDQERACGGSREDGLVAARDAFYRGDIAAAIASYHEDHGGLLTRADLAAYRVRIEPTVAMRFAGAEVHCCGPWSQGPALAQVLGMLEGMDLGALGHNSPAYAHALVEVFKLAFADRERWIGDPRFVDVPLAGMLDAGYLAARRRLVDPARAWPQLPAPGDPATGAATTAALPRAAGGSGPNPDPHATDPRNPDTSYVCVVDRRGNVFSATPSDVSSDTPVIPGTGLCPSSRGSQSRPEPGHPASVAPGKRPRLTPNPALALEEGRALMAFGTPGGDVQIQAMAQVLVNMRVFGMDVQSAIEAPRFASYSQPSSFAPNVSHPGLVMVESRVDATVPAALARLGHRPDAWPEWTWKAGGVCAIRIDHGNGVLHAGADPRRAAYAMGR
jgi:gamma-glutamyltranspeptidase/glutathione hydrolase